MAHKDYNINMINIIVAISIFLNCIALFQPVFISERGYSFNALHQGDPAITWTYLLYGITTFPLEVITLGLGGNGINYLWITYMSPLEKVSTPFNLKVECQFPRIIPQ